MSAWELFRNVIQPAFKQSRSIRLQVPNTDHSAIGDLAVNDFFVLPLRTASMPVRNGLSGRLEKYTIPSMTVSDFKKRVAGSKSAEVNVDLQWKMPRREWRERVLRVAENDILGEICLDERGRQGAGEEWKRVAVKVENRC